MYAIQARESIAALWRAMPSIIIEIRRCPAHKGVPGNEKADEWTKLAAEGPDTREVEWLRYADISIRHTGDARSLAHLKREVAEKKFRYRRELNRNQKP